MRIETGRLVITDFTPEMARAVHLGSLDENMRRFLPDEVFETEAIAAEVIAGLIDCYADTDGPFVHPVLLQDEYAGYVQLVPTEDGWEVGYHTVKMHAGKGYATEAVRAFLPVIMERLHITRVAGICDAENAASIRVLEECGFIRVFEGEGMYQGNMRPIVRMVYTKRNGALRMIRSASDCQKSQTLCHSNSPSADCKSKIGDMRGDFRAFPSGKASLRERTAGSVATSE